MNIFDKFMVSREVTIKEGEITLDQQRVIMFPVNFIARYATRHTDDLARSKKLYRAMKKGMFDFSMPLGKAYALSYRDFLDRWIKYNAFAGWGIVEYQLIDTNAGRGFLTYKNLSVHSYLKNKGIKNFSDPLLEGIIAGALSSTFKIDVDVVETKCISNDNDVCVFNWGPKDYLNKEFPNFTSRINEDANELS